MTTRSTPEKRAASANIASTVTSSGPSTRKSETVGVRAGVRVGVGVRDKVSATAPARVTCTAPPTKVIEAARLGGRSSRLPMLPSSESHTSSKVTTGTTTRFVMSSSASGPTPPALTGTDWALATSACRLTAQVTKTAATAAGKPGKPGSATDAAKTAANMATNLRTRAA
eukprot:scaffold11629_cov63-Phaeocystis_antarctica.AAC.6